MKTSEENRARLLRFVEEVVNTGEVERTDRFVRQDFVDHDPPPGASPDISGIREAFARVRVTFPDFHATVEDLVAEGDRVAYRWTFRGTHLGDLGGIPPTGKAAAWSVIGVARFVDGRIAERWQRLDTAGLLRQLGVSQPAAQSADR
jgi:steroid delta-isomerase-like uncharacterized protein